MEIITEFAQSQFLMAVPVILAMGACVLLFIYSIRPAQQPKFKLGFEDKKQTAKKKKSKEKKPVLNGHVTPVATKSEKSPAKEAKKSPETQKKEKKPDSVIQVKKPEVLAKPKALEVQDKKKNNKKTAVAKPVDFDDGNWETVPSKGEKKKKVDQPTIKKEKKLKQVKDIEAEQEKTPVENVDDNKPERQDLVETIQQAEPEEAHIEQIAEPEVVPVVEETKEKPKKQKVKKPAEAPQVTKPAEVEPVRVEASEVKPEEPKSVPAVAAPSGAVFDELGDTWTEAKPVKKSKKKARRD